MKKENVFAQQIYKSADEEKLFFKGKRSGMNRSPRILLCSNKAARYEKRQKKDLESLGEFSMNTRHCNIDA